MKKVTLMIDTKLDETVYKLIEKIVSDNRCISFEIQDTDDNGRK